MEAEVLATLLGVALAALVAACGAGFQLVNRRFDRLDDKVDRLEAKVDNLIMALAGAHGGDCLTSGADRTWEGA